MGGGRQTPAGTPPRWRGGPDQELTLTKAMRITPASAGRTGLGVNYLIALRDHPRVGGKDTS
ncbi:hypothetical protein ACFH04_14415 [Streptomyces noboritoensis]|uniref:Uncharacterized protein n=1 Tax=Streptomyces noboritoensis TaxID=67337 RepID=A0ABV6TGG9_9ACTN